MSTSESFAETKKHARLAGLFYLAMFVLAIFPQILRSTTIDYSNAALTASRIASMEQLWRIATLTDLLGQVAFIFLGLRLWRLFSSVSADWSRLLVTLIVASVPIAMVNQQHQYAAFQLIAAGDSTGMMHELHLFDSGILIAEFFWGAWLFPFGFLAWKSGFIPKVLGALLMAACFCYILEPVAGLAFPVLKPATIPGLVVFTLAETLTMLWLVIIGARRPRPASTVS